MTKLSVNINKIATLRNSRGGNLPSVVKAAADAERYGAQGITVHPRPDQRHIRYADVYELRKIVKTELNIEGNPVESFTDLVMDVVPDQVTLVPDTPDAVTSNSGWDTRRHLQFLREKTQLFHSKAIRVSIFLNPDPSLVPYAAQTGADRIELYTEGYATGYSADRQNAVEPYVATALEARKYGLGVNAGHDLSLDNLAWFVRSIPFTAEVSIGHALICDALYLGLENTIQLYLRQLK
ncbi:MAG: pyridoxine 5'-phosphate synthase [Rikenellaceae bacterium]|nr:pyridoxine 5'-phosphate synthase [Rikenellaceae bacterium]